MTNCQKFQIRSFASKFYLLNEILLYISPEWRQSKFQDVGCTIN